MLVVYVFGGVVVVVFGTLVYFLLRRVGRKGRLRAIQSDLFLVRLPELPQEGRELAKEVFLFEQLLSGLSETRSSFVFEAAVPHVGEEIHFYVSVPRKVREMFIRQVYSLWSSAKVEEVDDYNVFNSSGVSVGAWVGQGVSYVLPIRTYKEIDVDTFSQVLGGLAKVNEIGEGGALQVVVRPVSARRLRKKLTNSIQALKKGWKLKDVLRGSSVSFGDVSQALSQGKKKDEMDEKREKIQVDEGAIKALEMKAAKSLFYVNVRVVGSASNESQALEILNGVSAGFSQFFEAPERNELVVHKPKNSRGISHQFAFREFVKSQSMILSSEEVASLFHFPTPFTEVPKVRVLKAKLAPPPSTLPKDGAFIGESHYRDELKKVYISDEDRRRHVYVIGQTGTGKSTLIENMVAGDAFRSKGVAVVDPHGELVSHVARRIPERRIDDVIIFDPSDLERPMGLNMLAHDPSRPEDRTFIVNELISVFDRLYDLKATGGPMFEQYVRNALLLLMEDMVNEPATLMEVPRIFTDATFRKRKLERSSNPTVIDFWEKEAVKAGGDAALANITPYITSKFNNFTANEYVRLIVGQEESTIDFRQLMDDGKILLVNLSKGKIGELNANLLGMLVVGKILMAALSRANVGEGSRRDFSLYIDEFQNFTTDSIAIILSEARKYRLNLVIAHQFIAQLTDEIRDSVFGNVGSKIAFRVGVQDAEFLVKDFKPVFDEQDLSNIDNFNAYASLLVGGETEKPFNMKTVPPDLGDEGVAREVVHRSRMMYGRDRQEVEQGIYERLRN